MTVQLPDNFEVQHYISKSFTYDTCVALRIFCVGDKSVYTDPQVKLASHVFTFYKDYNANSNPVTETEVLKASQTAGTIPLNLPDVNCTVYELAALINASTNWRAVVVGAIGTQLAYTASGTLGHLLAFAADGTEAVKCATEEGCGVFFDTSVAAIATACIGLEAMSDETDWAGIARVQFNTFPKTDAERDVDNIPVAGARVYQPLDRAAFLNYCYAAAGDGASTDDLAADFLTFYAVDRDGNTRQLRRVAGPGNNATNATTAELAIPIVSRNGERIVVVWTGTNMGVTGVNPALTVSGGVGVQH